MFGDYVSIYDIQRAVADEATKPIYYESRIAKLALNAAVLPKQDAEFEEIAEDAALTWFGELGYAIGHGPQLAPGEPVAERQ